MTILGIFFLMISSVQFIFNLRIGWQRDSQVRLKLAMNYLAVAITSLFFTALSYKKYPLTLQGIMLALMLLMTLYNTCFAKKRYSRQEAQYKARENIRNFGIDYDVFSLLPRKKQIQILRGDACSYECKLVNSRRELRRYESILNKS